MRSNQQQNNKNISPTNLINQKNGHHAPILIILFIIINYSKCLLRFKD